MANSGRSAFISTIRNALGRSSSVSRNHLFTETPTDDARKILERIRSRPFEARKPLYERLSRIGETIGLCVTLVSDFAEASEKMVRLILEKSPEWGHQKSVCAWKHPLIEQLRLDTALRSNDIPLHYITLDEGRTRDRLRDQVIESFVGITSADYCIANTGTLVMKTRPEQARSVSLVPSIHIAVIESFQVISDLDEFYTLPAHDPIHRSEGLTRCMTFVTGASRTADIEAYIVHGAHGPREVHLYIVDSDSQAVEERPCS